jgi:hypothetical protein
MALHTLFKRLILPMLVLATAINATHILQRHEGQPKITPKMIQKRAPGMMQASYFGNWDIYAANFRESRIYSC